MEMTRLSHGLFALNYQHVNLAQLVREAVTITQIPSVSIETHVPEDLLVWADHDRLLQAVENLLSNAAKYAPQGTA